MQFHHDGYQSTEPRVRPAEGYGIDRASELPDEMDLLIVGTGPAGMLLAAQMSRFPTVHTRIIEQRGGRLEVGQADGVQARTVETFQAFGFRERIQAEAYRITETAFWKPDPADPSRIVRVARTPDDPAEISEFWHLVVNQARVLDYFADAALEAPGRIVPDYGIEYLGCEIDRGAEYPVRARLRATTGPRAGQERVVRTKYLVGADGARSSVRASIGRRLAGDTQYHAWGVMDVVANTDFPDIRTKTFIQASGGGTIIVIPREGQFLFRLYVDLGAVPADDGGAIRATTFEQVLTQANRILRPYTLDVRSVAWFSVYEVAHRLADAFDDVPVELAGQHTPRAFIMGDACHTHSAKAGQGMNVSMQDGYNLGWKLGHVLSGIAPESLLSTYSLERQVTAKALIDYDQEWSAMAAKPIEEYENPNELEQYYRRTAEFTAGFSTHYAPSLVTAGGEHQGLATGFPIGRRFKSAEVVRRADGNPLHLGHLHEADGRWRVYVFADRAAPARAGTPVAALSDWLLTDPDSPVVRSQRPGADLDAVIDVKVIYQQDSREVEVLDAPAVFLPERGPHRLTDLHKVFCAALGTDNDAEVGADIFEVRGISRDGAIVVVRPDQYVAAVLPLTATGELAAFFRPLLID
ncbi:MAG TPA: FAD-dependent monooxygenase [Microbacteriaceae bacterium]|nr:FAD-dependent monooxygenase [Microbacteriaceae bacterium]